MSIDFLNLHEARRVLQQIEEPRDKAIVLLFLSCGLQLQEATELNLADVHWETKELHIPGKRDRVLPLTEPTYDALVSWSKERVNCQTDKLFITTKGKVSALSERGIDQMLRKYGQKARVSQPVSAQTLRNTYAIQLLKDPNISLKQAAKLLGVSDKEGLKRYQNLTPQNPVEPSLDTRPLTQKLLRQFKEPVPEKGQVLQSQNGPLLVGDEILFGRDKVVEKVRSAIHRARPILLTGPLGIGKTQILKHVARQYPNALYVDSPAPTKTFLESLCKALDPDYTNKLGSRPTASELADWLLARDPLHWPILFVDELSNLKTSDEDLALALLDKGLVLVAATDKPLDKLKSLEQRFERVELDPLGHDASLKLIHHLTQTLSVTDPAFLETHLNSQANGHPGALVELCRQLSYEHVVTT
ncbi:MAG: tyrosine-type recombinase/integrase, partial [Candidatus Margulisiibacteriota bacterium]